MRALMVSRKQAAGFARYFLDRAENVRYDLGRDEYVIELRVSNADLIMGDLFGAFRARKFISIASRIDLLTDASLVCRKDEA